MKRITLFFVMALIVASPFPAWAKEPQNIPSKTAPVNSNKTKMARIHYEGNMSFKQVLDDISSQTGVKFKISEAMSKQIIYAHVNAGDWKTAIKQLLNGFSVTEMWSGDLTKSTIWIHESANQTPTRLSETAEASMSPAHSQPPRPVVAGFHQSPSNEKLKIDSLVQLPPDIQRDPEVLRFLSAYGVNMPSEIKAQYGERLENLPPPSPMLPHVRNHPAFTQFLQVNHIHILP